MDKTKNILGVVTMVFEDYDLLKRWYDYYAGQVGPENLYVFSHGNDPKHRRIAKGANVISIPRDPSMQKFDQRRWTMLGAFTSGLLSYFNWFLVTDVDEMVVVDPNVAPSLPVYLQNQFSDTNQAPVHISPLGLNIVHIPEEESSPMREGEPVLSQRRYFYPSRVYSKPCLVRMPVAFAPGGHTNSLGLRMLSDDLYMIHLKFCDMTDVLSRGTRQAELVEPLTGVGGSHVWQKTIADYNHIRETYALGSEDIELPEIRSAMMKQKQKFKQSFIWGPVENTTLFQLPKRFSHLV